MVCWELIVKGGETARLKLNSLNIHDAESRRLQALALKSLMDALGLLQCHFLAGFHTLHSFG
jgi:hypothetical protein